MLWEVVMSRATEWQRERERQRDGERERERERESVRALHSAIDKDKQTETKDRCKPTQK